MIACGICGLISISALTFCPKCMAIQIVSIKKRLKQLD